MTDHSAIQQRTVRALIAGQIAGSAALGASVTVGAFVVQELLNQQTPWAGISTATVTVGTAVASRRLSALMVRRGRRPGLTLGYLLAVVGAAVICVGIETEQLWCFLIGLLLFGAGQAGNLLARYAATDLALPDQRGRAMSTVVFASTFGAVFGPTVVGPAETAGEQWFGLHRYSGPFILGGLLFLIAAANAFLRLRPDPLLVAGRLGGARESTPSIASAVRNVVASANGRLALTAMVVSQTTMVAVMAMTPVHMKLHGHEDISQFVVSLHIAGMYAFAPLIGRLADQRGRQTTIEIGAWILTASTVIAAASGEAYIVLFPALWLLGLGWNFGLIGGSALLSESVAPEHRVAVQGTADLLMSLCGGIAGFSSGFIRKAVGYHALAVSATLAAGVLLVVSSRFRRSTEPSSPSEPSPARSG
ncbi:MAG TPA: MFS transporter [Ilumatobacteraceae bacterium]|nr:MFS transporter [Ilumatobacteraceae bacterium]